jgi:hypothetical protein
LGDRLFVTCGFDLRIKASTSGKNAVLDRTTYERVMHTIIENGIEIAIFDPLMALHNFQESNEGLGPLVYDFFGPIANTTKCAIEIVHHTRKPPPGTEVEYTTFDARGGGAFIFATRSGRIVNTMKKSEAELFDIEERERFSYFRTNRDKTNMARKGLLGWYRFEVVPLDNARPEEGRDKEEVGVVVAWKPPDALAPLSMYSQADKDYWRDLVGRAADDDAYGVHPNSKNWFGREIAARLKLDLIGKSRDKNFKATKAILKDLIEDGVLKVISRVGKDNREHDYLGAGDGHSDVDVC